MGCAFVCPRLVDIRKVENKKKRRFFLHHIVQEVTEVKQVMLEVTYDMYLPHGPFFSPILSRPGAVQSIKSALCARTTASPSLSVQTNESIGLPLGKKRGA